MKITIITPAFQQANLLVGLYHCVSRQTWADFEWRVLDTSREASEQMQALADSTAWLTYQHLPEAMSVGEKRNALIREAQGEVIAHFSPDVYYAPNYLTAMAAGLEGYEIVALSAWFLYSPGSDFFGYWDTSDPKEYHYSVPPDGPTGLVAWSSIPEAVRETSYQNSGFSLLYQRDVALRDSFPDEYLGDEAAFLKQAFAADRRVNLMPDTDGFALNILSGGMVPVILPQYQLPRWLLPRLFGAGIVSHISLHQ